ncbi:hypothetical protein NS330_12960 [Curtobacterium citreum]|nr:hypothetical protein NS330_12960 [Curtobacterium citreum]
MPSTTVPGDGPADTTDPTQTASSSRALPSDAARAAGTVNAVTLVTSRPKTTTSTAPLRSETYKQTAPNGSTVTVRRDLETGDTEAIA